jgi:YVTN family beta-propeller protein
VISSHSCQTNLIFLGEGTFPYSAAISPDGKWVIAANNQKPFVSLIDVNTDNVVSNIDVGTRGARGTAYSAFAFVSLENTSEVVIISLASQSVVQRLSVGPVPRGL